MNNLANLLSDIGKLNEAEQMYVRSLAGQTRTIGGDHEETIGNFLSLRRSSKLGTKYNLGILYHQLGRLEEAEKYAQEAYNNYCHRFGIDHVNTLTACHNVAVIKKARNLPGEAEYYYRQTLSGQQLYLGLDHEDTLRTMINLAALLHERSKIVSFN
jgi:tetratricopeptide (TPR) repeat protein